MGSDKHAQLGERVDGYKSLGVHVGEEVGPEGIRSNVPWAPV